MAFDHFRPLQLMAHSACHLLTKTQMAKACQTSTRTFSRKESTVTRWPIAEVLETGMGKSITAYFDEFREYREEMGVIYFPPELLGERWGKYMRAAVENCPNHSFYLGLIEQILEGNISLPDAKDYLDQYLDLIRGIRVTFATRKFYTHLKERLDQFITTIAQWQYPCNFRRMLTVWSTQIGENLMQKNETMHRNQFIWIMLPFVFSDFHSDMAERDVPAFLLGQRLDVTIREMLEEGHQQRMQAELMYRTLRKKRNHYRSLFYNQRTLAGKAVQDLRRIEGTTLDLRVQADVIKAFGAIEADPNLAPEEKAEAMRRVYLVNQGAYYLTDGTEEFEVEVNPQRENMYLLPEEEDAERGWVPKFFL